jgi:LmbE family N-acetylglucosaminyl deacetylase
MEAARRLKATLLPFARLPDGRLSDSTDRAAAVVAEAFRAFKPERVYVPHEADEHEDHRAVLPILRRAVELSGVVPWALGYEVWSPMSWFDQVEAIDDVLDRKLHAIAAYPSQLAQFSYDRAARGLAMYRGAIAARCEAAEVFCSMDVG